MPPTNTFQLSVITPEQKVLECDATFVAFPAHDGEMGALSKRAPLVCKLGIGPLRVETSDPSRDREGTGVPKTVLLFIDEGFAQVLGNRLTILTEQAKRLDELDAATANTALTEARALRITDTDSYTARDKAIRRAQVRIKLSQSSS